MSYAPPRRVVYKKKKDYTAFIILVVALIALPALGYGVYIVLNKPKPEQELAVADPNANLPIRGGRDRQPATPRQGSQSGDDPYNYTYVPPKGTAGDPNNMFDPSKYTSNTGNNYSASAYGGASLQGASTATEKACKKLKEAMELRKSLVVWLFDRSPSAEGRREEVVQSLKTQYPTLVPDNDKKAATTAKEAKLLTVVGAFASDAQFFTDEPVPGDEKVFTAIDKIKGGSDGNVENTFRAISAAITKYAEYTEPPHLRNVSIIVVTDEAGDDQGQRDAVMEQAKKASIAIYVIGSAAEFGSTGATDTGPEGSAIVRGPESREVESIKLETNIGRMMGSQECGIGPYSLAALCRETNGEYFVVGSMTGGSVNLPATFYPKYMPERDYQEYVKGNKAMQALIAAGKLGPAKQISGAETTFTTDEQALPKVADIDRAQRPQALIKPALDELYDTLKKGESDRTKLVEPRHKAAFDLAMGRTMAAKVRTDGYVVLLAAFKAGRKASKPGVIVWRLEPADGIEKNSVLDTMSKKAREYLEGVKTNYPNTPWAQAAEQELSQPIGWKWVET